MKHSVGDLIDTVYRYYPRGILSNEPRYTEAEEYGRLIAARRKAGVHNEAWPSMLKRLCEQFPENSVQNRSLHLPTGSWDACYSAWVYLPNAPGEHSHTIGFFVSFLVPYYVVYCSRMVDDLEEMEKMKARGAKPDRRLKVKNTLVMLPDWLVNILPDWLVEIDPPPPMKAHRNDIRFDFASDEQPYASWIARDIEATWGYERMPPEVGKLIVPDVSTNVRRLGEATLYDCFFSDDW